MRVTRTKAMAALVRNAMRQCRADRAMANATILRACAAWRIADGYGPGKVSIQPCHRHALGSGPINLLEAAPAE